MASEISRCPILETRLYVPAHLGSQEDTPGRAGRVKETSGKAGPALMSVLRLPSSQTSEVAHTVTPYWGPEEGAAALLGFLAAARASQKQEASRALPHHKTHNWEILASAASS